MAATWDGTRLLLRLLFVLLLLVVAGSRCGMAQQPSAPSVDGLNDNFGPASFNPSVAILIVVLVSAFFFLGFFSIYIRRCGGDPFGGGGASLRAGVSALGGVMARSRRQRGLDPAVLETFPTLAFAEVKELRIGKGSLECAVCLSEFEDDETLRLLPPCSHAFHPDCIDSWLASHVTCPVCRCNLVPDPDAPSPAPAAPDLDHPAQASADSAGAEDAAAAEPDPLGAREGEAAVVIDVADEGRDGERRKQEAIELQRIGSQRQAMRARSGRRPARFPRSHSTGHSLTTPTTAPAPVMAEPAMGAEGNTDRYTLRLPEHVRREIVAAGRLKRTRSLLAFPSGGEESSRRGYRVGGGGGGGEGSSRAGRSVRLGRSERWPNFFTRTFSTRVPAWATGRRSVEGSVRKGEGEGSTRGKLASAVAPFDCFVGGGGGTANAGKGGAGDEDDESSTAALARRV